MGMNILKGKGAGDDFPGLVQKQMIVEKKKTWLNLAGVMKK